MVVVYNHTTLDEGYNSRLNCSICLGFNCGNGFNSRHLHHNKNNDFDTLLSESFFVFLQTINYSRNS